MKRRCYPVWLAVAGFLAALGNTARSQPVDTNPPVITCVPDKTVACNASWAFDPPSATDESILDAPVYDNSINDQLTRFNPRALEIGDEIVLAGAARDLSSFMFEYWGLNTLRPDFEGNVQTRIRFYANDGPLVSGQATPGTVLYDSGLFPVSATARAQLIIDNFVADAVVPLRSAVPNRFTWTIQFSGLTSRDQAGVDLYSPPVVGQSAATYWERSAAGAWSVKTNAVGPMNFAARVDAHAGQVTVSVAQTVTNTAPDGSVTAVRTWTAADPSGNTAQCSQSVTVQGGVTAAWADPGIALLTLPGSAFGVVVESGYPVSFLTAALSGVGAGYGIHNGTWTAWDVDYWALIYPGSPYTALAYDTTGTLPPALQHTNWDKVNYLLNHKRGTAEDIQGAIWHFIGGPVASDDPDFYPPSAVTLEMIAEADANGEGFVPGPGAVGAVLLDYTGPLVAHSILEVRRPQSAAPCAGQPLSLCVTASGSGPFAYRWYKDGTLLTAETGSCLAFTNLAPADAGQYRVEVIGVCGSATNTASVNVVAPVTATALGDLVRLAGQTATFSTVASGGGTPAYTWRHDGVVLPGQTSSTLTLSSVAPADAGTYTVEVAGPCNTATQTARLTVTTAPEFSRPLLQTNGTLMFPVSGGLGMTCVIQASTNLTDWTQVARVVNTNGTVSWTDPNTPQHRKRFYRILLEP